MGIFGRFLEAASLTRLMWGADSIVLQLTGNNPKEMHPALYRRLLETVKQHYDEQEFIEAAPLKAEEAALIMLTLLYAGSVHAESVNPRHRPDVYKSAIEHLRIKMEGGIRASVSIWSIAITLGLEDSAPEPVVDSGVDEPPLPERKIEREPLVDLINRVTGVTKDGVQSTPPEVVAARPRAPLTEQQIAEIKARHRELRKKWGD